MLKKFLIALSITIFASTSLTARVIVFENKDRVPISGVNCIGLSQNMDSIAHFVSDGKGSVGINNQEIVHVLASHSEYNERLITLAALNSDTITLTNSINLKEIVVTPADVEEFATHTSYRISQSDFKRYSNVLQSLNVIPNLTVLSNGSVYFEGDQNVKILIDGVEASVQEIQSLSKDDISKIDVYQMPPLRFLAQGVGSVIDIRLKSKLYGGNGSVDISQSFYSLKGDNSAAFYYNYKQSRFSVLYNNTNKHYRKFRQSEVLDYDFDGVRYLKTKEGLDSKSDLDNNSLNLSYQVNKPGNFLYNAKAGIVGNRDGKDLTQKVSSEGLEFLATNNLHTSYTRYNVDNYFEKTLRNGNSILANVSLKRLFNSYDSQYCEDGGTSDMLKDSHSKYKSDMNIAQAEIQFNTRQLKFGYLYFDAYDTYHHSTYRDMASPFHLENNIAGATAQWIGWKDQFVWYATMGVQWLYSYSSNMNKANNLIIPVPKITILWRPRRSFQLSADYNYSGSDPSIAQLSETDQWLDNRLVYHGNSLLKPYKTHTAGIRAVYNNRYLNLAVRGAFISSPGMICDMYTLTDRYMLQTIVNLDKYRVWSGQLDATIKPLGNNKLTFWNRIIAEDVDGSNKEYSWSGYRFQWMSTIALNLDHWTAELFYQYPGKVIQGQLERPRAQCWSATVLYRPISDLSVGLEWFMPFGKGFKESEHTVNSAPVYADTEVFIKDRANMISLKLSYNFSFGRNRNKSRPRFENYSPETGILSK